MELAEQVVKLGLDVILHLTCTNMPKEKVDEALKVSHPLLTCSPASLYCPFYMEYRRTVANV